MLVGKCYILPVPWTLRDSSNVPGVESNVSIFSHVQNETKRLSKRVLRGFGPQEYDYRQKVVQCIKILSLRLS